jgi:hypothetical protein
MFGPWKIRLPGGARKRGVGEIRKSGWWIRYAFGREQGADYLDCYAVHRMTNDRHVRILESGEVRGLPAKSDMLIRGDGAKQAIVEAERAFNEHNRRVDEELERKFGSLEVGR